MKLFINGKDLFLFALGLLNEEGKVIEFTIDECEPYLRLKMISDLLDRHSVEKADVSELWVVNGPGSATALRSILTTVNTWKFVEHKLCIKVITNNAELSQGEQIKLLPLFEEANRVEVVAPEYEHEVNITKRKTDHLKRAL